MFDRVWTAESVVAAVFRNPGLLEDYVSRGLTILDGLTASSVLNRLVQLKKLMIWRKKVANFKDESNSLKAPSYDVDIFSTIEVLSVQLRIQVRAKNKSGKVLDNAIINGNYPAAGSSGINQLSSAYVSRLAEEFLSIDFHRMSTTEAENFYKRYTQVCVVTDNVS
jgi:hypothetical protein